MRESVRVAAVAVDGKPGRTEENLEKIRQWAARAADEGATLVLFPELSLTGFIPNHPTGDHEAWLRAALREAWRMAEPLSGPAVERLIGIAAASDLYLSAGLLENAGNVLHNTQVLVGPRGLAGCWRKLHIPMFEAPFYVGGPAPEVAETPLARIGANICFDALLPESTRLLAIQNAEVVLFPFACDPPPPTPAGWAAWAAPALRARSVENGVFAVACNYVGHVACAGAEQRFPGGGLIAGPKGETLAEWTAAAGEPSMIVADLRREALEAARAEPEFTFRFRRPELYRALAD